MSSALPANSATLHNLCPNSLVMTDCCSRRVNWSGLKHEATSWGLTKEWQRDQLQNKPWESKVESTPIALSGPLPLSIEEQVAISSHKRNSDGIFLCLCTLATKLRPGKLPALQDQSPQPIKVRLWRSLQLSLTETRLPNIHLNVCLFLLSAANTLAANCHRQNCSAFSVRTQHSH